MNTKIRDSGYQVQQNQTIANFHSRGCEKCKPFGGDGWIIDQNGEYHSCGCLAKRSAQIELEESGITVEQQAITLKDFNGFDSLTNRAKDIAKRYIENGFDNTKNWIAYLGQSGSGKTLLSIAIAMGLLSKENPPKVVYMPYLNSMRVLKSYTNDNENYIKYQQKYLDADLLIMDDLFKDKIINGKLVNDALSAPEIRHINPIINHRYLNKKNTVISSECSLEQLTELDESIAGRICEMCCNGKTIIAYKGSKYNYRFSKLNKTT